MRTKNISLMQDIVEFIDAYFSKNGRAPTYREIAARFSVTAACVSKYIKAMSENGMLRSLPGSRGIKTLKMFKSENENMFVGVVGTISCGLPVFAEQNIETYIPLPKALLGNGKFFMLRASGDSMINAGINDGDFVVIRQQETASNGDIVVALIDNEVTLKRFYVDLKNHKIRLHPENDNYADMCFDNVTVQGVAVKVIKSL